MSVSINIPDETMEVIAARAAEIVVTTSRQSTSPWMTRREAAEYLGLPLSRLEKDRRIPCHSDRGRVLYHRDELDVYFLGFGH